MNYHTLVTKVIDLTTVIQQIPAPSLGEAKRARFIYERFLNEHLLNVSTDELGNVYARLPGKGNKPPIIVSAHSDTVFPVDTDLTLTRQKNRIYGPGIGDNSLGVAGLFGLLWALRMKWGSNADSSGKGIPKKSVLPGDIWLVANVAEEGLGNLRGMRAVVNRFGENVLAYLILEGMALGQVYHRGLGVVRYRIHIETQGGHSWADYGHPSAVHELAKLINQLITIPLPKNPRTTLNVGVIEGGTTINTIAAHAHLDLDLRSESALVLNQLTTTVEEVIEAANQPQVKVSSQVIGSRPAGEIPSSHPLIHTITQVMLAQGIQPVLTIGSTDANIPLSLGLPAACLGLSTGGGAHSQKEYINIQPLFAGLPQLVAVVENIFREL
jgi:acetylornithine deacetylase/succinyl-diaminopimelate desuccinylase-like protein